MLKVVLPFIIVSMLSTNLYSSEALSCEESSEENDNVSKYQKEKYPLHTALSDDAPLSAIQKLIDQGASVNLVDDKQSVPLCHALDRDNGYQDEVDAIRLLLSKKANPDVLILNNATFKTQPCYSLLQSVVLRAQEGLKDEVPQAFAIPAIIAHLLFKHGAKIDAGKFNPSPTAEEQQAIIDIGSRLLVPGTDVAVSHDEHKGADK